MKNILLFALCAAMSVDLAAQQKVVSTPPIPITQLNTKGFATSTPKNHPLLASQRKAVQRRTTSIIANQPKGVLHDGLTRTSLSLTTSLGTTTDNVTYDGKVCKWVDGTDGYVYIYDPVVAYHTDAWVRGEWGGKGVHGDTIYVTGPQLVLSEDYYGYFTYNYYADRMQKSSGEWSANTNNHKTMFIWRNDSLIQPRQTNAGYGLVNESGEAYGLMDYSSVARPMTDKLIEPSPELLATAREMAMRSCYSYVDTTWNCRTVKMIVDEAGGAIYLQNINDACPDAWIKGNIDGDKVTFPNNQYLGIYEDQQYYAYLSGVKTTRTWWDEGEKYYYYFDLCDGITFTYDRTTGSLHNDDGGFAIMPGATAKYYISYCLHPHIVPITGEAKAPISPVFVKSYAYQFGEWNSGMAPFLSLQFHQPSFSDDGTYLDAEKMSYVFYLDTMRYELCPDEYSTLSEPMTEIPANFTDNYYFYTSGMSRAFYLFEDCDSLGVQSIYTDGDKKYYSPIAYFNMSDANAYTPNMASDYYDGSKIAWGTTPTGKREVYDVAKFMGSAAEVGQQVEGVRIKLENAKATIVKAWAAKAVKTKTNGDLTLHQLADAEIVAETNETTGEITFTFDQPVVVTNEGLYVGYSLQIDEPDGDNISPIALLKNEASDGFWCHTTRTYRHWRDLSHYGVLDMDIILNDVPDNAAKIGAISSIPTVIGNSPQVSFNLINVGNKGVQSFEYNYEINNQTYSQTYDLGDKPLGSTLGDSTAITISLPSDLFATGGTYPLTLSLTKVNEQNNGVSSQASTELLIYSTLPHHRSVEEEYTGTWCGWCPRGLKALEMMSERYPDDFIAISYHSSNSDPMDIGIDFPNNVSGFPNAWIDRTIEADPYYGTSSSAFGIEADWQKSLQEIAPADINLKATVDEAQTKVNVNAEIVFPLTRNNARYKLEYILVHDSLSGTTSAWAQTNYYAGYAVTDNNLKEFYEGSHSMTGLYFNDVLVATSRQTDGYHSLPTSVTENTPITDSFTFTLSKVVNKSGNSLIQNIAHLRAIVLLIDSQTGRIVNANQAPVVTSTGISPITIDTVNQDLNTPTYDIYGKRVNSTYRGVIIQNGHKTIRR